MVVCVPSFFSQMCKSLGAWSLTLAVGQIITELKEGFMKHVRGASLHFLLTRLEDELRPNGVSEDTLLHQQAEGLPLKAEDVGATLSAGSEALADCLEDIMGVVMDECVGDIRKEKSAESGYKSKVRQVYTLGRL